MTFECFYSIVQPHKAASLNTVRRTKIAILCIFTFSIIFSIPHLYTTLQVGKDCIPLGRGFFTLPFKFLVLVVNIFKFLNSVCIAADNEQCYYSHVTYKVKILMLQNNVKVKSKNNVKVKIKVKVRAKKSNEKQIYVTLLLVTFIFLCLSTPMYALFFYNALTPNQQHTTESFARFYLITYAARQAYFTNYGINFFLYVISGSKFRSDLMNLLRYRKKKNRDLSGSNSSQKRTVIYCIQEE